MRPGSSNPVRHRKGPLRFQTELLPLLCPSLIQTDDLCGLAPVPFDLRLPAGLARRFRLALLGRKELWMALLDELLKRVGQPLDPRRKKRVVGPNKRLLPASPFSTTKRRLRDVEAAQKVPSWECF